jgi:DNA replication and repair protein RecF
LTADISVALTQLQISHVRNLRHVRLNDLQRVNVFFGRNGSGKTSILESIHLLGMARSFRNSSMKSLITHDQSTCTVFGTIAALPRENHVSETPSIPLGVQRNREGDVQIKLGGKLIRTVAEVAGQLPLQVLTSESFGLLTGAPGSRRQYLDWGVFHVEQRFFGQWQRFQRAIKQRNHLLRRGKIRDQELVVWTREVAESGTAINEYRKCYFDALSARFRDINARLAPNLGALELRFQQGWDRQLTYIDALQHGLDADLEQGYTHCGPQRADLRVVFNGHLAAEILSRGQQKLVVCGLKLAQGQLMTQLGRGRCTYLIDDLPSELDHDHSSLVCEVLASMEAQVFITCIDQREISSVWPKDEKLALFHVEQGAVQYYASRH